jgi:hypothetical protein
MRRCRGENFLANQTNGIASSKHLTTIPPTIATRWPSKGDVLALPLGVGHEEMHEITDGFVTVCRCWVSVPTWLVSAVIGKEIGFLVG